MGTLDTLKRGAGDISFVAKDVDGLVGLGAAATAITRRARRSTVSLDARRNGGELMSGSRRSRGAQ